MQRPWSSLDVCILIGVADVLIGNRRRVQLARGHTKNNKQPEAVVAMPRTCTDHYALLLAYSPVPEHWGRWWERTKVNTRGKT